MFIQRKIHQRKNESMKIYITGFMGSGKTTFGKEIAELIGYEFIDLDKEVEKIEDSTIPQIFKDKGEDAFREAEYKALMATAKAENAVVATGGGTPCYFDNMRWMNDNGITIYLKLFEGELKKRLEPDMNSRPLLNGIDADDLERFVYNTLRERAYYYHQAKIVIDPLSIPADELVNILRQDYI